MELEYMSSVDDNHCSSGRGFLAIFGDVPGQLIPECTVLYILWNPCLARGYAVVRALLLLT